jgi:hypothetical protein
LVGCNRQQNTGLYGFDICSPVGISDVAVKFSDGSSWPIAYVGKSANVNDIPGPIPDAADIDWTDNSGAKHQQHVQLKPLPPPTASSYNEDERKIYFFIGPDNAVKLMGHDPLLTNK